MKEIICEAVRDVWLSFHRSSEECKQGHVTSDSRYNIILISRIAHANIHFSQTNHPFQYKYWVGVFLSWLYIIANPPIINIVYTLLFGTAKSS